jgi:hypothetical protein
MRERRTLSILGAALILSTCGSSKTEGGLAAPGDLDAAAPTTTSAAQPANVPVQLPAYQAAYTSTADIYPDDTTAPTLYSPHGPIVVADLVPLVDTVIDRAGATLASDGVRYATVRFRGYPIDATGYSIDVDGHPFAFTDDGVATDGPGMMTVKYADTTIAQIDLESGAVRQPGLEVIEVNQTFTATADVTRADDAYSRSTMAFPIEHAVLADWPVNFFVTTTSHPYLTSAPAGSRYVSVEFTDFAGADGTIDTFGATDGDCMLLPRTPRIGSMLALDDVPPANADVLNPADSQVPAWDNTAVFLVPETFERGQLTMTYVGLQSEPPRSAGLGDCPLGATYIEKDPALAATVELAF